MLTPVFVILGLSACQNSLEPVEARDDPGTSGVDADTEGPGREPDTEVDTDLGDGNMEWVRGDLTWSLDFDAAAEATGLTDCAYVRHYEAGQDTHSPWLCPDCDMLYRADVRFVSGLEDCYRQLSPTNPPPDELLGRRGGEWMRSRSYNRPASPSGGSTLGGLTWTVSASGTADVPGGTVSFTVGGTLDRSRRDADTTHGWAPPDAYSCGWPRNPAPLSDTHELVEGDLLPEVTLLDVCDEPVRLRDVGRGYLVVYSSAVDCLMCRDMAADQVAFEATLSDLPWEVTVVNVVSPSLQAADDSLSIPALSQWVSSFQLQGRPVLRDRGYGLHVLGEVFPTTVVVAPDGTVIDIAQGYAGSWDYWGLQIDQHIHGQD